MRGPGQYSGSSWRGVPSVSGGLSRGGVRAGGGGGGGGGGGRGVATLRTRGASVKHTVRLWALSIPDLRWDN